MNSNQMIIIDCGSVASQARFSMGNLSSEENPTGVIFGFLSKILHLYKQYNTKQFVFAWDSKHSLRREIYPEYKANRRKAHTPEEEKDRDSYFSQTHELRTTVLPTLGFVNVFVQRGYEADDIIASIVQENTNTSIIIVSEDADLYQLLSNNVSMLLKKGMFTKKKFIEKYGILPKQWADVKAIAGCNTDNVRGIPRIGEATALQYIKGTLSEKSKKHDVIMNAQLEADQRENREDKLDVYNLTKRLVRLPFAGVRSCPILEDKLSFEMFLKVCEHYGFESFLRGEQYELWCKLFGKSTHSAKCVVNRKSKKI